MFVSGNVSDSFSSTGEFGQERAPLPRQKEQNKSLLDKLTQEKLNSKSKHGNKQNDLSSGTGQVALSECYHLTSHIWFSFFC